MTLQLEILVLIGIDSVLRCAWRLRAFKAYAASEHSQCPEPSAVLVDTANVVLLVGLCVSGVKLIDASIRQFVI